MWCPANAEQAAYADIARGVAEFESLDYPAGREAAAWLKEEALASHPYTLTYLHALEGRVEGFFAIASSAVTLTQGDRQELESDHENHPLKPTQGASLVVWVAKHRDAGTPGDKILSYAASIALEVAQLQGTLAFVVDPFDDETKAMWKDRYGFRPSDTKVGKGQRRLWVPLRSV